MFRGLPRRKNDEECWLCVRTREQSVAVCLKTLIRNWTGQTEEIRWRHTATWPRFESCTSIIEVPSVIAIHSRFGVARGCKHSRAICLQKEEEGITELQLTVAGRVTWKQSLKKPSELQKQNKPAPHPSCSYCHVLRFNSAMINHTPGSLHRPGLQKQSPIFNYH